MTYQSTSLSGDNVPSEKFRHMLDLRFSQGRRISRARDQREDGGDMFLRNVGWLSTDYTVLYFRTAFLNLFTLEELLK
jgi:hypothetical protein